MLGTVVMLLPAFAHAANPVDSIASDDAFRRNVATLIDKNVHFDARLGLWFARLSAGPFSQIGTDEKIVGLVSPDQASTRVGTGTGTLRDVGISIDVAGNEAYFDYLGNDLFDSASDELTSRVDNPVARTILREMIGEFRPNLSSLLGPDAYAFIGAQYGNFKGPIRDAYLFSSYNGTPYFAGPSATWQTRYTAGQAGVMWRDGHRNGDYVAYGVMARYQHFTRPIALGDIASGGDDKNGTFFLQDSTVQVTSLSARAETKSCSGVFCFNASGWVTPLTGLSKFDIDRWGTFNGLVFAGGGEGRAGLAMRFGQIAIEPFVGLRAEWLMLLAGSSLDQDADAPFIITPDYFLWGPTIGVEGHLL